VHAQAQAHELGRAAAYTLVAATAWRMLHGWGASSIKKGDVALIWGGAGGLGSMAIQIAKAVGATSVAMVSGEDKFDYCMKLGAKGCINRNDFDHWGMLPHWKDNAGYAKWLKGVRSFGAKIWEVLGEKRAPNIVFEHPGETTIPTSIFVCETGGMVVVCAGTTGYNATVDLRYLWMRQKRLQGSHFANTEQCQPDERTGAARPARSLHVAGLHLRRIADCPSVDARQQTPARQHVGADRRHRVRSGRQRQAARGDGAPDAAQGRRAYHAGALSDVHAAAGHRRGRSRSPLPTMAPGFAI
jgi:NADPH:quinone reductase-like Zn-dependent oxidoreductase